LPFLLSSIDEIRPTAIVSDAETVPPPKATKAPKFAYTDPRLEQAELKLMIAQYALETIAELAVRELPSEEDTAMQDDTEGKIEDEDDVEVETDALDSEMVVDQPAPKSRSRPATVESVALPTALFNILLVLAEPTSLSFRPISSDPLGAVIPTSASAPVPNHLATLSALASSVNTLALEAIHNRLAYNPRVNIDNPQRLWEALFELLVKISNGLEERQNGMEVEGNQQDKKKHAKKDASKKGEESEHVRALAAGVGSIWALARNQRGLVRSQIFYLNRAVLLFVEADRGPERNSVSLETLRILRGSRCS
jgi:hypothetical protein